MALAGKTEATKWGWLSIAVTVLGVALISVPWIPGKFKLILAIPVYATFFYVYYKYLHLRKMAKTITDNDAGGSENRAARRQAERMQKVKK